MSEFDQYFAGIYGPRWPKLRQALLSPPIQGILKNSFVKEVPSRLLDYQPLGRNLWKKESAATIVPERTVEGILDIYILDPASVFVAESLGVEAYDQVLDMCAAPGGKSLVLFSALSTGELIANDLSEDRRFRMKKVFDQYIPEKERRRLFIRNWDAVQFGLRAPGKFDKVLLDAPCSGERHMMENSKEIESWRPRRAESLAKRQYGLLCAALLAARPGGDIVYSTCSLNPIENDGVVERLLKRKSGDFRVVPLQPPPLSEKTTHGIQFLPDACGFGPMYCCKIRKNESLSPN